jgi:hypothetical protein
LLRRTYKEINSPENRRWAVKKEVYKNKPSLDESEGGGSEEGLLRLRALFREGAGGGVGADTGAGEGELWRAGADGGGKPANMSSAILSLALSRLSLVTE